MSDPPSFPWRSKATRSVSHLLSVTRQPLVFTRQRITTFSPPCSLDNTQQTLRFLLLSSPELLLSSSYSSSCTPLCCFPSSFVFAPFSKPCHVNAGASILQILSYCLAAPKSPSIHILNTLSKTVGSVKIETCAPSHSNCCKDRRYCSNLKAVHEQSSKTRQRRDKKNLTRFHTVTLISCEDAPKMIVNGDLRLQQDSTQFTSGERKTKNCCILFTQVLQKSLTLTICANCSSVAYRSLAAKPAGLSKKWNRFHAFWGTQILFTHFLFLNSLINNWSDSQTDCRGPSGLPNSDVHLLCFLVSVHVCALGKIIKERPFLLKRSVRTLNWKLNIWPLYL